MYAFWSENRVLCAILQTELSRNKCRPQRIDVWQQAVDTDIFNPAFRSDEMRARMSGGKPDSVILTYVGRLGAGASPFVALLLRPTKPERYIIYPADMRTHMWLQARPLWPSVRSNIYLTKIHQTPERPIWPSTHVRAHVWLQAKLLLLWHLYTSAWWWSSRLLPCNGDSENLSICNPLVTLQ